MIKAEIKGKIYDVPTTWHDVTYIKAIKIIKMEDIEDVACELIGIDKETFYSLQNESVNILFNCIDFIKDVSIIKSENPEDRFKDFDYGSLTYGDTEKVRKIINSNADKTFLELAPEIVKILTGEDISEKPFSKMIGNVGFFLNQWIISTSSMMNSPKAKEMKSKLEQELKGLTDSEASVLTLN